MGGCLQACASGSFGVLVDAGVRKLVVSPSGAGWLRRVSAYTPAPPITTTTARAPSSFPARAGLIGAGGVIAATVDFLERLRAVTAELGILLIFDEVISFRVAPGGAQQLYGVTPDLTTLGKIIGGGLPVAAFGGRADVMELLDPRRQPNIAQGGTYNGNPLGMAAGLATMTELTPDVYDELNRKGARVSEQLSEVFASHSVPVQVNGVGSLLALHFTEKPVVDYRTMAAADKKKTRDFFLALVNHGVLMAPRAMGALSTPMSEQDIQQFIDAVDAVVEEQRPRWEDQTA